MVPRIIYQINFNEEKKEAVAKTYERKNCLRLINLTREEVNSVNCIRSDS